MASPYAKTVRVELGQRSYDVLIAAGNLEGLADRLRPRVTCSRVIVISDTQVAPLYAERCLQQLQSLAPTTLLLIPAGEASKSVAEAHALWDQMLEQGAGRDTLVIGLGGGVVGDLAGFVAACFARGLPFVQIPTSLLAQVDSSVGGKVGINLTGAKNMVGAFWQPRAVVVDLDVLSTLAEREYAAGLAEVVKYGVIADETFFAFLEDHRTAIKSRDRETLANVVARCCQIKAAVVAADETEQAGQREMLNYGHTFGHAIEAISGYGFHLHGEAVAMGMICASELASQLGMIEREVIVRQRELLDAFDLPTTLVRTDTGRLLDLMRADKKTRQGRIRFVLPTKIGHVRIVDDVADSQVAQSIEKVFV